MIKYSLHNRFDLQFFAAADEGKTEKATPKKREDARKEGQVAKSSELNTAAIILGFFGLFNFLANNYLEKIGLLINKTFQKLPYIVQEGEAKDLLQLNQEVIKDAIFLSAPLFGGLMLIGFLISLVQVGYRFSGKAIKPKFSKMDPIKGIKKMFSKDVIVELLKSTGKLLVLGTVLILAIKKDIYVFFNFYDFEVYQILANVASMVSKIGFSVGGLFLGIAALDYAYQKYKFEDGIKMSKQDLKDEFKQSEGDPLIKGKIKQKQRELAMKRMMQELPNADVIITNPTHFAVAIKYEKEKGLAPIVIAKGMDHLAQQIKKKGKEHAIELVENVPLARALYYTSEIGEEISPELYAAVAEVLAYVYQLKEV